MHDLHVSLVVFFHSAEATISDILVIKIILVLVLVSFQSNHFSLCSYS